MRYLHGSNNIPELPEGAEDGQYILTMIDGVYQWVLAK